jgi:truncated hemoglobin YjbI
MSDGAGAAARIAQHVMVMGMRRMTDAEVVSFMASTLAERDDPLSQYVTQRLEAIAVMLEASEATSGR